MTRKTEAEKSDIKKRVDMVNKSNQSLAVYRRGELIMDDGKLLHPWADKKKDNNSKESK